MLGGVATALEVIREEWRRMAETGPSADERDAAKTFFTGSYPLRFASSGNIANMLVGLQIEDLGNDYIERRRGRRPSRRAATLIACGRTP